jgi:hypothetical protein
VILDIAFYLPFLLVFAVFFYCVANLGHQSTPGGPFVHGFPGRLVELHHEYWGAILALLITLLHWPRELLLVPLWFMTDDTLQHFEQLIRWQALPASVRLHVDPESLFHSPLNRFWAWCVATV